MKKFLRYWGFACLLLLSSGLQAQSWPTPLDFGVAIERGDLMQARKWLDAGLSPDFVGDRYGTGLMIAAAEGNIPMMELFVNRGARLDAVNRNGEQALQLAALKGHVDVVKWLLERGAPVNREGKAWSALHYAVFGGHREIAEMLIQRGANVNARVPNDATALMLAAREGHEDIAGRLVKAGADPRLANDLGETAAVWAHRHGHLNIAKIVSTPEAFANLAKEPVPVNPQRSAAAPSQIDDLLRRIRYAEQQNLPTAGLQKALMAAVERSRLEARRVQKEAEKRDANTVKGVVVTARRPSAEAPAASAPPAGERVEVVFNRKPKAGSEAAAGGQDDRISLQLAKIRAAQQRGEPTDALRKELFQMISSYKKPE